MCSASALFHHSNMSTSRLVFFSFGLYLWLDCAISEPDTTLRLLHVLYRHGDRTPTKTFPNDPYQEDSWPNGFGQLTKLGMKQHQDLGRYFRATYDGFLSPKYNKSEIYVRSTDKDRTLMSAYSNLAGLYPAEEPSKECPDVPWQPVPVHTVNYCTDNLLRMGSPCTRYSKELDIALKTADAQEVHQIYEDILDLAAANTGLNTTDLTTIWDYVCDPIYIEGLMNRTLPHWVTPTVYDRLHEFKAKQYDFWFYTNEMTHLRAGPFMKELSQHIHTKMEGKLDTKAFFYSAHDSTVGAMLFAMDQWNGLQPPYTATLIWELHEIQAGQFAVQILYKNDSTTDLMGEPFKLKLKGCDVMCPVDKFLQIMKPMTFDGDWFAACGDVPEHDAHAHYSGTSVAIAVCVAVAVVILIIVVTWYYCKGRSSFKYQSANFSASPHA